MRKHYLPLVITGLLTAASPLMAKVSESEAARLGKDLTPVGATKAGSANGKIPAWPETVSKADILAEKPLFTIDRNNVDKYKSNLSPGQIALIKHYPSYKMTVYPSHRTAQFPKRVYDLAKKNATSAELVAGGNGLNNFDETVPFAIPQNGLEVIWNHITRFRGGKVERTMVQTPVQRNGAFTPIKIRDRIVWPQHLSDGYDKDKDSNILFYFTQQVLAPARLTGNILLVHETINQVKEPRRAWLFNAGQRRVRKAPQVAYDGPGFASEGQRTTDNYDMYNGAPDRYEWKLLGRTELYIPYNSYKLADKKLKYTDIIRPGHINPELTRHELHRVWVVEATLKDGERHVYAKRRFYIDEDSWQASVVDHYDGRGQLWRVSEAYAMQYIDKDVNVPWYAAEALYDLISGRYLVIGLTNEEEVGFDFSLNSRHGDFTPAAIRRLGKR